MSGQIRAKVTSRLDYPSRPPSPTKSTASLSPPPVIRAKAKVNSSANVGARKLGPSVSAPGTTARVTAGPSIPRAPSPFKPPNSGAKSAINSPSAPAFRAKISGSSRPHSVVSSSSPDSRPRALTSTSNANLPVPSVQNRRRGSFSSTLTAPPATRSHQPSPSATKFPVSSSEQTSPNGRTVIRVKSKVTRLAETSLDGTTSLPSSPSLPSRFATHTIPSASKLTPPLPSSIPAPISTPSSPTSVYHRFATTREAHTPKHLTIFQPFSSRDDQTVTYTPKLNAKVDPVSIPLPPQSPPGSTLSFSSKSSASRSSISAGSDAHASNGTALTARLKLNGNSPGYGHDRLAASPPSRSNINGLGIRLEPSPVHDDLSPSGESHDEHTDIDSELDDPDWESKAEAKSVRKIADLEITNRSLLTINSTLEATKHRQAKEIRALRRRLRESHLILPPSTFKTLQSTIPKEEPLEEDEDEDEEDEEEKAVVDGTTDETYRRVRSLIEGLIEQGKRALATKPEDLVENTKGGTKVLHEVEARTWRGEDIDSHSILSRDEDDNRSTHLDVDQSNITRPVSPSRVTIPEDDDGLGSEDEVEASLLEPDIDDIPSAPIPPITVTHSP